MVTYDIIKLDKCELNKNFCRFHINVNTTDIVRNRKKNYNFLSKKFGRKSTKHVPISICFNCFKVLHLILHGCWLFLNLGLFMEIGSNPFHLNSIFCARKCLPCKW